MKPDRGILVVGANGQIGNDCMRRLAGCFEDGLGFRGQERGLTRFRGLSVRRVTPRPWCIVALLGLIPTASAFTQEPAPLSLEALLREVAERSPVVSAQAQRAEAMRQAIPRARALDDPQLTLMTEDVPTTLTGGMPMLRLQANQMLPWPGKRGRMTRVAELESDVAGARKVTALLNATRG